MNNEQFDKSSKFSLFSYEINQIQSETKPQTEKAKVEIVGSYSGSVVGHWSKKEHCEFLKGILLFGNKWKRVAF